MILEPVALVANAQALLQDQLFALPQTAYLHESPRQLVPRIGQRGLALQQLILGPRELVLNMGKLLLGMRKLSIGMKKSWMSLQELLGLGLLLGLQILLFGLASLERSGSLREEMLCEGLALSSISSQQPYIPLHLSMNGPHSAQLFVKHLCFMKDGRGLVMNTRSIEHS
jgi:hypothetical protein